MNRIKIGKRIVFKKQHELIKHLFIVDDGFMIRNLRFNWHYAKFNPPKERLHVQIWLPFIHIMRDNNKWAIGNRFYFEIFHKRKIKN